MEAKCGRVEATIFRLLLGILDIVPLRGKGTGLKTRLYKGKRAQPGLAVLQGVSCRRGLGAI
jgi:hypothetical protein